MKPDFNGIKYFSDITTKKWNLLSEEQKEQVLNTIVLPYIINFGEYIKICSPDQEAPLGIYKILDFIRDFTYLEYKIFGSKEKNRTIPKSVYGKLRTVTKDSIIIQFLDNSENYHENFGDYNKTLREGENDEK